MVTRRSYTTQQSQETSPTSAPERPSRSRRGAAPTSQDQAATSPSSKAAAPASSSKESNSDLSKRSIKLSLKSPPSRLREIRDSSPEAEESSTRSGRAGRSAKNKAQPPPQQKGRERPSRAAKGKKAVVDSPSEDEGEEEEEEEAEAEDDEVNEDEEDAEGDEAEEEEDADGDVDMPDAAVTTPSIKVSRAKGGRYSSPSRALKQSGSKVKSVEEKEMSGLSDEDEAPAEDDEEEPEDEEEEEEEDEEEEDEDDDEEAEAEKLAILNRNRGITGSDPSKPTGSSKSKKKAPTGTSTPAANDYDANGLPILDDRADDIIQAEDVGSDELDSDPSGDEDSTSRGGTPGAHDPSKLTRRQRGPAGDGELMSLSNEAQKKKFFTADELNLRRAEMARRRKDLSEKRDKAEKEDTLNRLLNKQPPKRKSKKELAEEREAAEFGGRSRLGIVTNAGSDEEEEGATPALEEAAGAGAAGAGEVEVKPGRLGNPYMHPSKVCVRTVIGVGGSRVGVPVEWLADGQPAGRVFHKGRDGKDGKGAGSGAGGKENVRVPDDVMKGRMVMEVD